MKNIKLKYLLLLFAFTLFSCGKSDDEVVEEQEIEITNDYNLIALNNKGGLYYIGNNTGEINQIGQLNLESDGSLLATTSFVALNEKIYAIEFRTDGSGPRNNLLTYDLGNNVSDLIQLKIPNTIPGDDRAIGPMVVDGNNLIGILFESTTTSNQPKHVVHINLENYEVTDFGVVNLEDSITSMVKIESKLYVSTNNEGTVIVDLTTNVVDEIKINNNPLNASRMAKINNSELAIMQFPQDSGGFKPKVFNLLNQTISDNLIEENYGLVTIYGNTIIKNQVYLNLISATDLNLYFGILKTNFQTNENTIVEINTTDINGNMIILGTTN